MAKKKKRTVMYSSADKKLYAVRDAKGEFADIESYQKAQSEDMRKKSKAELAKAPKKKKAAKKVKTAKPAKKKKKAKKSGK
jgi:hypothetical protein